MIQLSDEEFKEIRDQLKLVSEFMDDAHTLDYNEDRTNSWISFMAWKSGEILSKMNLLLKEEKLS
jgi:hypothetical protein